MKDITINWKFILILSLIVIGYLLISFADDIPFPPFVLHLGLIIGGFVVIAMGIGDIRSRTSSFSHDEGYDSSTYHGFSAIMWGVMFVLLGVCLIVAGIILLFGAGENGRFLHQSASGHRLCGDGSVLDDLWHPHDYWVGRRTAVILVISG